MIALDVLGAVGAAAISAINQWGTSGGINGWAVGGAALVGGAVTSLGPWALGL